MPVSGQARLIIQHRYYAKVRGTTEFKKRRALAWKKWADKNREKLRERDRKRSKTRDWKAEYRRNREKRIAAVKRSRIRHRASRTIYEMRRHRRRQQERTYGSSQANSPHANHGPG